LVAYRLTSRTLQAFFTGKSTIVVPGASWKK